MAKRKTPDPKVEQMIASFNRKPAPPPAPPVLDKMIGKLGLRDARKEAA